MFVCVRQQITSSVLVWLCQCLCGQTGIWHTKSSEQKESISDLLHISIPSFSLLFMDTHRCVVLNKPVKLKSPPLL